MQITAAVVGQILAAAMSLFVLTSSNAIAAPKNSGLNPEPNAGLNTSSPPKTIRARMAPYEISAHVDSALAFVRTHQTVSEEGYEPGQWRAQVTSTSLPSKVGVGQAGVPYEEPSAFVASAVGDVLAEIYFLNPSHAHSRPIPLMIAKTTSGFYNYQAGPVFYFYPPKIYNEFLVRGPRFMFLNPRWFGFTNTPPDSDTSSNSFLLLGYKKAMDSHRPPLDSGFQLPQSSVDQFTQYRDVNRVPHIWNQAHGNSSTGGYLTWLYDEKNPQMPHDYFARPDQGIRIPFNKNDVDCVVNASVMKMLTIAHREDTAGYRETCSYLNGVVANRQFFTCGMYYPSDFMLPYALSSAIQLGVKCLEPSHTPLVQYILGSQEMDGSWQNHRVIARPDAIQSTAWALNTLLLLGDRHNLAQRVAAQRGVDFLLSQSRMDTQGFEYWSGEVFYAAIFLARRPVVWRSAAYTTATAARALDLADQSWGLN